MSSKFPATPYSVEGVPIDTKGGTKSKFPITLFNTDETPFEFSGGGEPDEYIKTIVDNTDGTYTSTDKEDNTVTWDTSGGSGQTLSFDSHFDAWDYLGLPEGMTGATAIISAMKGKDINTFSARTDDVQDINILNTPPNNASITYTISDDDYINVEVVENRYVYKNWINGTTTISYNSMKQNRNNLEYFYKYASDNPTDPEIPNTLSVVILEGGSSSTGGILYNQTNGQISFTNTGYYTVKLLVNVVETGGGSDRIFRAGLTPFGATSLTKNQTQTRLRKMDDNVGTSVDFEFEIAVDNVLNTYQVMGYEDGPGGITAVNDAFSSPSAIKIVRKY